MHVAYMCYAVIELWRPCCILWHAADGRFRTPAFVPLFRSCNCASASVSVSLWQRECSQSGKHPVPIYHMNQSKEMCSDGWQFYIRLCPGSLLPRAAEKMLLFGSRAPRCQPQIRLHYRLWAECSSSHGVTEELNLTLIAWNKIYVSNRLSLQFCRS